MAPFPDDLGLDTLRYYYDDKEVRKLFQRYKLIPKKPKNQQIICPTCGTGRLGTEKRNDNVVGWRYRCLNRECKKVIAPTKNTFFSQGHLSLYESLAIFMYYVQNCSLKLVIQNMHLGTEAAVNYYNFCKEICMWQFRKMMKDDGPIGGKGLHVEIDECYIRRKGNKGRLTKMEERQWKIFGGLCAETGQYFAFLVPKCTKKVLWRIIRDWIRPGSIIHSDGAAVYNELSGEEGKQFGIKIMGHEVVVHRTGQYVAESDLEPGHQITTNRIENLWKYAKRHISGQGTKKSVKKDLYKYLYFRQYLNQLDKPADRLNIFLKHVGNFFSLPLEEEKERNYPQYIVKISRKIEYKL